MRVLVCGGRQFSDRTLFMEAIEEHVGKKSIHYDPDDNWLPLDVTIIAGDAKGADKMAIDWAVVNHCDFQEYLADWKTHGRAAGPIRNQQMLDEGAPDKVMAFPGGRGTADMVRKARAANLEVIEILPRESAKGKS